MTRRAAAALVAIACAAGCKKGEREARPAPAGDDAAVAEVDHRPERVVISRVEVHVRTGDPAIRADQAALTRDVTAVLADSGQFARELGAVPATHQPRVAAIEIGAHVAIDEDGGAVVRAAVEARVSWADRGGDPAPRESIAVEVPVTGGEPAAFAVTVLSDTIANAARGIAAKEKVRSGGPAALLEPMETPDVDLQLWALEVIRERHLADGYDAAVAALGSPSRDVREAAVGALIAVGDPRAVKPIADATDTTDAAFVQVAIDAATALGGEEAVSYLEFLARGHSDDHIREAATRGLDRLTAPDAGQAMP